MQQRFDESNNSCPCDPCSSPTESNNGEKAGEPRAAGSYWARVVSKEGKGSYRVEDAEGVQVDMLRLQLRHRVFIEQCHAGVTGDKKHDR